jgi:hypothetical protein
MAEKNTFGGGNPRSLYTPMSETEQEVLERLVETRDLIVKIVGWGILPHPKATQGDLRVAIPIQITFDAPEVPIPVFNFDLELWSRTYGVLLFKERYSTVYNGQPLFVGSGTHLSMIWDIAIQRMDPKMVKMMKPGAIGLTSRWTDKDTGDMTLLGNSQLTSEQKRKLLEVRAGEAFVRKLNKDAVS